MGDFGIIGIAKVLEINTTITQFSICIISLLLVNNQIYYLGAIALSKMIKENKKIYEIYLCKFLISYS